MQDVYASPSDPVFFLVCNPKSDVFIILINYSTTDLSTATSASGKTMAVMLVSLLLVVQTLLAMP